MDSRLADPEREVRSRRSRRTTKPQSVSLLCFVIVLTASGVAAAASLTSYGGAGMISGSCHLLTLDKDKILLDCGLFMDKPFESRNWNFPFAPSQLTAVALSHAHLDHSGRLPLLYDRGFHGPVICTPSTKELVAIMLPMMARIHLNEHHAELAPRGGFESLLANLTSMPYEKPYTLASGATITLLPAGHILGSAMISVEYGDAANRKRVLFTGDFGNAEGAILTPKAQPERADTVIIESTYGNRTHSDYGSQHEQFMQVLRDTVREAGITVIPAFVLARTQKVLAFIYEGMITGQAPRDLNVYVMSPTATKITKIYAAHDDELKPRFRAGVQNETSPFSFNTLHFTSSLKSIKRPAVIIAPTADADQGKIAEALARFIDLPDTRVCFVSSYQEPGSVGEQLVKGAHEVEVLSHRYEVRGKVYVFDAFSDHGDQEQLIGWLRGFSSIGQVLVVHGSPDSSQSLAALIQSTLGWPAAAVELERPYQLP